MDQFEKELQEQTPDEMGNVENAEKSQEKTTDLKKEVMNMICYLGFIFVAVYLIITFVGQRTMVNGDSMEPTLQHEDNLIMDKLTYRFRDPERFEVIIFPCPTDTSVYYIKRVIGLPGETIQIQNGAVYINGELLTEDVYGIEEIKEAGIAYEPLTLAEDEYFVLGDNRPISRDSRYVEVGPIHRDAIEGRALLRFYPFNKINIIQ